MSGSIFGKNFCISTFGESHGKGIGVVVDGCPAGLAIDESLLLSDMSRRKPGNARVSTARQESDEVEILSGVFEGQTTGTPIAMFIRNTDQRSHNYDSIKHVYRPSHADYSYDCKYGIRDYRGGGRSSARETAARVAGGSIAKHFLKELGISVTAYTHSLGPIQIDSSDMHLDHIHQNMLSMPNNAKSEEALTYVDMIKSQQDSIGGIVECVVTGVFPGIGDPVFDRLDALLGQAIMSINAVKAFEIGAGFKSSLMTGSEYNDSFYSDTYLNVHKKTNHSGGILGGISDGSPITIRAHFKPTPSISLPQSTIDTSRQNVTTEIKGRHDPTVVPRAVVVVEAMVALTLADLILSFTTSNISRIKKALL